MLHFEHTYETAGSDLAAIAVDIGLKMPIVFDDGTLDEVFHLRVTPQHVITGKDGRIQYVGWKGL